MKSNIPAHRTSLMTTQNPSAAQWETERARLRRWLQKHPVVEVSPEEIDAHFDGMPSHYWGRVSDTELAWGLQSVHQFLHGLVASPSGTTPAVVTWRHFPKVGVTKVLVTTWDRAGLLTKFAGYTAALRLNIVRAEVYTRADDIVLDVFWLSADGKHVSDADRLKQLGFLIEGGLSEPPRFVSTWACESHKYAPRASGVRTTVAFDNTAASGSTIMTVQAAERLGLLHDMLQALSGQRLNIIEAMIDTVDGVARDVFYLTDEHKQKVDPGQFESIKSAIIAAVD
jgi:[protein-PII] uridylyltransferase